MNSWASLDMPRPLQDVVCTGHPRKLPQGSGKWFDVEEDMEINAFVCEIEQAPTCLDEWTRHDGSCYLKVCERGVYADAEARCKEMGGELATIKNKAENQLIAQLCGLQTCLIGLRAASGDVSGSRDEWLWADGTSIGYKYEWHGFTNWDEGEPNNMENGGVAVMNFNDLGKSIRKDLIMSRMAGILGLWSMLQLGLPLALLVCGVVASRFRSPCVAHLVCLVSGVASVALMLSVLIWLSILPKVGHPPDWPHRARLLFLWLAILASCQVCMCCMATSKAQELQWVVAPAWAPMGMRTVFDNSETSGPSLEMVRT